MTDDAPWLYTADTVARTLPPHVRRAIDPRRYGSPSERTAWAIHDGHRDLFAGPLIPRDWIEATYGPCAEVE